MVEQITTFTCKLCGRPVSLKDSVNDDLGDPVHQSCYDDELLEREAKRRAIQLDE
jgi:hypothetical protein